MPLNRGCRHDGPQLAPQKMLDAGMEKIFTDAGHSLAPVIVIDTTSPSTDDYLNVAHACRQLCEVVDNAHRNGQLPIVLGGDHALSWGSIAASLDNDSDTMCIYVDAHGDFNTPSTSPSGNIHGMHLAFLMGFYPTQAVAPTFRHRLIHKHNLHFLATRALDHGERHLAATHHLDILTAQSINADNGMQSTVTHLQKLLDKKPHKPIHLSFDIDAIDPAYAPATGVPEPNGITPDAVRQIIETVAKSGRLATVDIVEYNPLMEPAGSTPTLDVILGLSSTLATALANFPTRSSTFCLNL